MKLFFPGALANRLGEFAEFLGEPCDGGGDPSLSIAVPICADHEVLQFVQLHARQPSDQEAWPAWLLGVVLDDAEAHQAVAGHPMHIVEVETEVRE